MDVVHADTDMSESFARLAVTISNLEVIVVLRAIVMRQLEDAFAVRPMVIGRDGLRRVVGEEVEVEFVVWEGEFVDLFQA